MTPGIRPSRRRVRGGSRAPSSTATVPSSQLTPSTGSTPRGRYGRDRGRWRPPPSSPAGETPALPPYAIPQLEAGLAGQLGFTQGVAREDEDEEERPLPPESAAIIDAVLAGRHVFFTGPAGTGKSTLLRAITRALDAKLRSVRAAEAAHGPPREYHRPFDNPVIRWNYVVSASTGLAASNIGGRTVHSLSGIGMGNKPAHKIAEDVGANSPWRQCGIWIIDESCRPFGGMQVIFCGDFLQLPPVVDERERAREGARNREVMYAFEATAWDVFEEPAWGASDRPNVFLLSQVYRQDNAELVRMLREVRLGAVSDSSWKYLESLTREIETVNGVEPLCLFPTKVQVHRLNLGRLGELGTPLWQNQAQDRAGVDDNGRPLSEEKAWGLLTKYSRRLPLLDLKVGAQVMLLANLPEYPGLVNGTMGVVTRFMMREAALNEGIAVVSLQGYHGSWASVGDRDWPVVRFMQPALFPAVPNELLVPALPDTFYNVNNRVEAMRIQVPLNLAWALTIHKAQGLTLSRVKVDLTDTFEYGQVYVALSRATNPEGLQVTGLDRNKIVASRRVKNWYASLERAQAAAGGQRCRPVASARRRVFGRYGLSEDSASDADSDTVSGTTSDETRRAIAAIKRKRKRRAHRRRKES